MVLAARVGGGAGARPILSPDVGRFMTEDPAEDGINWYVYVRNNPATYTDPTGLYEFQEDPDKREESYSPPANDNNNAGGGSNPNTGGCWSCSGQTSYYQGRNTWVHNPPPATGTGTQSRGGSISQPVVDPAFISGPPDMDPTTGPIGGSPQPQPGPGGPGPEGNGNDNAGNGDPTGRLATTSGQGSPRMPSAAELLGAARNGLSGTPPAGIKSQNDDRIADIPNTTLKGCYLRTLQAIAEFLVGKALTDYERVKQIHEAVRRMRALKVKDPKGNHLSAVDAEMIVAGPDQVLEDAFSALGYPEMRASVGGWPPPPGATLVATILIGKLLSGNDHYRMGDTSGRPMWDPWDPNKGGALQISGERVLAEVYVWDGGVP